jgi:hypothetical protein
MRYSALRVTLPWYAGALPGLLIAVLVTGATAQAATKGPQARVEAIDVVAVSHGSSLLGLLVEHDALPDEQEGRDAGSAPNGAPAYRGRSAVVLDLRTDRELLRETIPTDTVQFWMALCPPGHLAAFVIGRRWITDEGTWGEDRLYTWDLLRHKQLFWRTPAPFLGGLGVVRVGDIKWPRDGDRMQWSRDGDYLAFTIVHSFLFRSSISRLYIMKPDGSSGFRELPVKLHEDNWFWSPTEDVIYALDYTGDAGFRVCRVTLDGEAPKAIWSPAGEPVEAFRETWLPSSGVSPDGRWLVVQTEELDRQENTALGVATLQAVRTDGSGSVPLGSWTPVPQRHESRGEEGRTYVRASVQVAWSSDASTLYALVSTDVKSSQLYRWKPGEWSRAAVGPKLPFASAILVGLPGSSEMLVWPSPESQSMATHGALVFDADGRTRLIPSPAEAETFVKENQFATVDEAGRVITIAGKRGNQSIRALDLRTRRSTHVYP